MTPIFNSMLQVQVLGRLGRDAEVREHNGNKFISFAVAVDEKYTDNNGQEVKRTEWLDVVTNYSGVAPYLKTGTLVFVQGRAKTETFTSKKDGSINAKIKVRASIVQLCGSANSDSTAAQPQPAAQPAPAPQAPPVRPTQNNLGAFAAIPGDEDLPF